MNTERLIKKAENAELIGWDWKLLAQCANSGIGGVEVIIFHEREFPSAQSPSGKKRISFTQGGVRISKAKAEKVLSKAISEGHIFDDSGLCFECDARQPC